MARPEPPPVVGGFENWDVPLAENLDAVFQNPYPLPLSISEPELASNFPPAQYYGCMAVVGADPAIAVLYFSDGTNWKIVTLTP